MLLSALSESTIYSINEIFGNVDNLKLGDLFEKCKYKLSLEYDSLPLFSARPPTKLFQLLNIAINTTCLKIDFKVVYFTLFYLTI